MSKLRRALMWSVLGLLGSAGVSTGQSLGVFQWQQLPYCNVLTVNVVQNGSVYQLDGIDNQCGAARSASVSGLGFVNPNGTIGLGLTIVTNDGAGAGGAPLHLDVTLALPSASGTWRDNTGQTGGFTLFAGGAASGTPRPAPVPAFAGGLAAGGARITSVGTPTAAADAANKGYVDAATANVRAALIGEKVWKARVSSTGVKSTTGPYTSSRVSTGNYSVVFDVTGLGIPTSVGFPFVVASPFGLSAGSAVIFTLTTASNGGFLTQVGTQVLTFNAAGASADMAIGLMLTMPDPDSGSPVSPLSRQVLPPGARCATVGQTTTCELRFTEP